MDSNDSTFILVVLICSIIAFAIGWTSAKGRDEAQHAQRVREARKDGLIQGMERVVALWSHARGIKPDEEASEKQKNLD